MNPDTSDFAEGYKDLSHHLLDMVATQMAQIRSQQRQIAALASKATEEPKTAQKRSQRPRRASETKGSPPGGART